MTSQFFHEIVIFPLTNVPDECRAAVIVKGSIMNIQSFYIHVYTTQLLYKYVKSLWNDVYNLSANMHLRTIIYQEVIMVFFIYSHVYTISHSDTDLNLVSTLWLHQQITENFQTILDWLYTNIAADIQRPCMQPAV
jgi:hypothetical protein